MFAYYCLIWTAFNFPLSFSAQCLPRGLVEENPSNSLSLQDASSVQAYTSSFIHTLTHRLDLFRSYGNKYSLWGGVWRLQSFYWLNIARFQTSTHSQEMLSSCIFCMLENTNICPCRLRWAAYSRGSLLSEHTKETNFITLITWATERRCTEKKANTI